MMRFVDFWTMSGWNTPFTRMDSLMPETMPRRAFPGHRSSVSRDTRVVVSSGAGLAMRVLLSV